MPEQPPLGVIETIHQHYTAKLVDGPWSFIYDNENPEDGQVIVRTSLHNMSREVRMSLAEFATLFRNTNRFMGHLLKANVLTMTALEPA